MNTLQKLTKDCLEKSARFQGAEKFLHFVSTQLRKLHEVDSVSIYKIQPRLGLQKIYAPKNEMQEPMAEGSEVAFKASLAKIQAPTQVETKKFLALENPFSSEYPSPWLGVFPLRDKRKAWGMVVLGSQKPFPEEQFFQLEIVFEMVLREIRLDDSLNQHKLFKVRSELNALLQADGRKLEPIQLIAHSCPIISRYLGAERTTFFVFDPKDEKLHSIYAEGPERLNIVLGRTEGLVGQCFSSLKTTYTNDPYQNRSFQKKYDSKTGFMTCSSLVTPLYMGDHPFGVLQVLNKKVDFTEADRSDIKEIAKTLSSHLNFYAFIRGNSASKIELDNLLETIPEVLYKLDKDGNFEFLSQQILKWGYIREDLVGSHFSKIVHPEDMSAVSRETVLPRFAGKTTGDKGAPALFDERRSGKRGSKRLKVRILPGPHIHYEDLYPGIKKGEEKVFFTEVNASGYWETDHAGNPFFVGTIGIITDITERHFAELRLKSTQQNLIRAERFAGLGTLAAGIAHDFNNILAAIGLSAEVSLGLLSRKIYGSELTDTLKTVDQYVEKASDLTGRLLSLGRSNVSKLEASRLQDIVNDSIGIVRHQLESKGIELKTEIEAGLPECILDAGQLRDVFINLATNSMHAIEEAVQSSPMKPVPRCLTIRAKREKEELALEVEDTGIGIEAEILPKVFDPFFSTKNRDFRKGTGLGLAMVFSIIQGHGGRIEIQTVTQKTKAFNPRALTTGTCFKIHLPILTGEIPKVSKLRKSKKANPLLDSVIYIVDDERAIVDLLVMVLRVAGYRRIHSYYNGTEALMALETSPEFPDLIITDVQMPPLDGLKLCETITQRLPQKQPGFIISSGKLNDEYIQAFKKLGIHHFLNKPSKSPEILQTVSAVLNQQKNKNKAKSQEREEGID